MSTWSGRCPCVSCVEVGPHAHDVCKDCGADNHGNASCATCTGVRAPGSALHELLLARDAKLGRPGHTLPITTTGSR